MNPPFPSPFETDHGQDVSSDQGSASAKDVPPKMAAMVIDNRGLVTPGDSAEVYRTVQMWLRSGMVPKSYTRADQVFFAHQSLVSVGVNPLTYLRFTAYVQNSLVFFGDLPLALVKLSNKLDGVQNEYFADENGAPLDMSKRASRDRVYGATCEMRIAGAALPMRRTFTLDDAREAGKLPAKPGTPWVHYRNRMLQMKARGWLIKDLFPEVLNGVPQAEYDFDLIPHNEDGDKVIHAVAPVQRSRDLNALYGEDQDG